MTESAQGATAAAGRNGLACAVHLNAAPLGCANG